MRHGDVLEVEDSAPMVTQVGSAKVARAYARYDLGGSIKFPDLSLTSNIANTIVSSARMVPVSRAFV